MGSIVNDYSVEFDGSSFFWRTANIDDLDILLSCASRTKEESGSYIVRVIAYHAAEKPKNQASF
jgi:hypothetical protein